jgi:hypothetical protein
MRVPYRAKKLARTLAHEVPKAQPWSIQGKPHFQSVARIVKRTLGIKAPICFTDSVVTFSKIRGDSTSFSTPKGRKRLYELYHGRERGAIRDGKCVVYVDTKYDRTVFHAQIPTKTKRDAMYLKNSVVAHEVAETLYFAFRGKRQRLDCVNREIGEMVGRFFELDYLFQKNPRLGKLLFEQARKEAAESDLDHHTTGSRLACKLFDTIKSPQQRRKIIALIARGTRDFETEAQVEKFLEQKNR